MAGASPAKETNPSYPRVTVPPPPTWPSDTLTHTATPLHCRPPRSYRRLLDPSSGSFGGKGRESSLSERGPEGKGLIDVLNVLSATHCGNAMTHLYTFMDRCLSDLFKYPVHGSPVRCRCRRLYPRSMWTSALYQLRL